MRAEIGAWLAWAIVLPTALVNVVVNMSQMSAMVEGTYGALGMLPPAVANPGLVVATIALTGITVVAAVLGGYKRVEKIMTALLLVILACFIIVAIKGLVDWRTWLALGGGLVPQIPADLPVVGSDNGPQWLHADDGDCRAGPCAGRFLSYGYLARNAGLHRRPTSGARSGKRCRTSA